MGWTKEYWKENIVPVREKYKEDPLNVYSKGYYSRRRKMRHWEIESGRTIAEMLNIESMIDFGCGLGSYLEGTLQGPTRKVLGIDIGADIAREYIPKEISPYIYKGNIGEETVVAEKYDCSFSIEAAEHLLPEEESTLINNMINATSRLIVFTGARSYNYYHLNPGQTKEDWAKKFTDRGCVELFDEEEKLREALIGKCKKHIINKLTIMSVENR